MTSAFPYLSVLVLLPAGAGLVVALVPGAQKRVVQAVGLVASLAVLGISAAATVAFSAGDGWLPVRLDSPVDLRLWDLLEPRDGRDLALFGPHDHAVVPGSRSQYRASRRRG